MVCAFTYGLLRKHEDTGKELLNEEYQSISKKVIENVSSLSEKTEEKDMLYAQANEIFDVYMSKTEQLRGFKSQLETGLRKIERLGEKEAVSPDTHEEIEALVGNFKQLLTEIREGVDSKEAILFKNAAESNISTFIENYSQQYLISAFSYAEKSILETAKGKLQAEKQEPRSMFNLAYS